jgi:hypothetical protein
MSRTSSSRMWALCRGVILLALQAGTTTPSSRHYRPTRHPSDRDRPTLTILPPDVGESWSADECAAVAAAIDRLFARQNVRYLVLRDSTSAELTSNDIESLLADSRKREDFRRSLGIDESAIIDFAQRNESRGLACLLPRTRVPVWIAHPQERQHRGSARVAIYDYLDVDYPGLISVSRVGVSADGRQALLTVRNVCGGLCGSGWIVVLRRDRHQRWRVSRAEMLWIS